MFHKVQFPKILNKHIKHIVIIYYNDKVINNISARCIKYEITLLLNDLYNNGYIYELFDKLVFHSEKYDKGLNNKNKYVLFINKRF